MKKIKVATLLLLIACSFIVNNALASDKKDEKTVTFNVNMDCHSCVKKIEGNIPYEKGVKDLQVSLEKKEVTVTFRTDKTSTDKLIEAFKKLGYTASIAGEAKVNEEKKEDGHKTHSH
jgi:copper chaperone CopZ